MNSLSAGLLLFALWIVGATAIALGFAYLTRH